MIEVLFISAHVQLLPCVRIGSAFFLRASRNIRITVGTEKQSQIRGHHLYFLDKLYFTY